MTWLEILAFGACVLILDWRTLSLNKRVKKLEDANDNSGGCCKTESV